jgi:hypothetical protein
MRGRRIERGVDAVTMAAPTHLHRDIAVDCVARGIHILLGLMVERPEGGGWSFHARSLVCGEMLV